MQMNNKKFGFAAAIIVLNIVYHIVSEVENIEFFVAGGSNTTHIVPCSKLNNLP